MNIYGKNVNYIQYGEGDKDVVLLHGWGQNIEMMNCIGNCLKNARVTIFDLPGFGNSEEFDSSKSVGEYADWLKEALNQLGIDNPILIGHSFGGRVAIKYASKYPVSKLVLIATPIVRRRHNPTIQERFYKVVKRTPLGDYFRKKIGSSDYNNASPVMRETLVKVVNEDLSEDVSNITAPTIFLAGTKDTAVSLNDTHSVIDQMKDAAVIEQDGTHYAYLENIYQTVAIINEFLTPQKTLKR
ncbi:MAG: alpha/beta hydrolase [Firmicutes bacterium]|nr:alpha/beta hydrolase [Bacillota bacterium]